MQAGHSTVSLPYLAGEATSVAAFVGAFLGFLPHLAAGMAAIWYGVMIYESWDRRRHRRRNTAAAAADEQSHTEHPHHEG